MWKTKRENYKTDKSIMNELFNHINDIYTKEKIELFLKTQDKIEWIGVNYPNENNFNIDSYRYNVSDYFKDIADGYLITMFWENENLLFLFKHIDFIENNVHNIIKEKEWSTCSYDKTNWIISSLFKKYYYNKTIDFSPIKDWEKEYSYFIPKTILNTETDILNFFEALQSLYYWINKPYLNLMK